MSFFPESDLPAEPLAVVFGGAGYLGTVLVRQLLAEGYRVRVFDNFLFGDEAIRSLQSPGLEIVRGDICDAIAVAAAVERADAVVLLSAIVGHLAHEHCWAHARTINYLASTVVLDAAVEHGASRFIFASTNSVYGIQSGIMYETTIPEPVSLYSRLKLRMEERVIGSCSSDFHPTALRIATCHGVSPRMRFDLVVNGLVRDALLKKEITIECGEQYRSLIHVDDAARSFVSCLKAHENLVSGEIFNVGAPDQNVQINYLANLVRTYVPETRVKIVPGKPDLIDYHLSCAKIEKVLDFKARWTLEQSIQQIRELLHSRMIEDPYSLRYHNTEWGNPKRIIASES